MREHHDNNSNTTHASKDKPSLKLFENHFSSYVHWIFLRYEHFAILRFPALWFIGLFWTQGPSPRQGKGHKKGQ